MEMRTYREKLNNKGSAMILVLVVLSFIMILGVTVMGTALLNLNMRSLNRKSDKNFYYLETMLDKVYAQTGRVSSEILKEQYAKALEVVYQEDGEAASGGLKVEGEDGEIRANDRANAYMRKGFMKAIKEEFIGSSSAGGMLLSPELNGEGITDEASCAAAAEKLKTFSGGAGEEPEENLQVSVGTIFLLENDSGMVLKDLCLTYLNPETDIETSITVDLEIDVPYVRFINEGDALLDYILVANEEIQVNRSGESTSGAGKKTGELNGNIYGGQFLINRAEVTANGSLLTSAGTIRAAQESFLKIGPDIELRDIGAEAEETVEGTEPGDTGTAPRGVSRVWADGIVMDTKSRLKAEDTSFYINDDLTFTGNDNLVEITGNYYGYGNEGASGNKKLNSDKSSAILFNDKNSILDFSGLNSLMLAGRAYLRFPTSAAQETSEANLEKYIYPMGESLAVRTTQTIYLVPETQIWIAEGGQSGQPMKQAFSNPLYFDEGQNEMTVYVSDTEGVAPDPLTAVSYKVERIPNSDGSGSAALRITPSSEDDAPAVLIQLNNKIYVYYNFKSNQERSVYFENYLKTEANKNTFEQLLHKSGITGEFELSGSDGAAGGVIKKEGQGAIILNDEGTIATSGSLYQVNAIDKDGEYAFRLIPGARSGDTSSLSWVNFSDYLNLTFKHLKENLAETEKVSNHRAEQDGFNQPKELPVGNYVNLPKLKELAGKAAVTAENEEGKTRILLTGDDVILELKNEAGARITGKSARNPYYMEKGLIVTSGNVTIQGEGSFDGLIIAAGSIDIDSDKAVLTADPDSYLPLLDAGTGAGTEAGIDAGAEKSGESADEMEEGGNGIAGYFFDYGNAASTVLNQYEDFVVLNNWRRARHERGGEEG